MLPAQRRVAQLQHTLEPGSSGNGSGSGSGSSAGSMRNSTAARPKKSGSEEHRRRRMQEQEARERAREDMRRRQEAHRAMEARYMEAVCTPTPVRRLDPDQPRPGSPLRPAPAAEAPLVTSIEGRQCSPGLVEACAKLMWATPEFAWAHNEVDGKVDRDPRETVRRMLAEAAQQDDDLQSAMQWHVVQSESGELLACAKSFIRVISHSGGVRMPVMALSNVAAAQAARGKGLGQAVVEAALQRLDAEESCTHFLFETAIPAFYQRLGAKLVEKELVINSTGDRIAFEDEYVMVYPAARHWPEGEIDLLGPGY